MEHVKNAIDRITEIASTYVSKNVSERERENLGNEIIYLLGDLFEEYDDKKFQCQNERKIVNDSYFDEKLSGLRSFALMAIGVEESLGYSNEKIVENVKHYAYLVGEMANK